MPQVDRYTVYNRLPKRLNQVDQKPHLVNHPPMGLELENRIYDMMAECLIDAKNFDKACGTMAYVLCRHPLTKRGGSAITDWLVRRFALSQGYTLGVRSDEPLSYDWMAFISFDEQAYAEWFLNHAYEKSGTNKSAFASLRSGSFYSDNYAPVVFFNSTPLNNEECIVEEKFFAELGRDVPIIEKMNAIKALNPSASMLNNAFVDAAEEGNLEIIQNLSTFPLLDPTAFDNAAFDYAVRKGHLPVVEFLCTLPGVEEQQMIETSAILRAKTNGYLDVVNYLVSCSCYNPFEPDISLEKQQRRIKILTEAGLEEYIDVWRETMDRNTLGCFQ